MMPAIADQVQTLNRLLRGELSAVETYSQALAQVGDEVGGTALCDIARQHQDAVEVLRQHIIRFGGEPDTSSGVWGAWAAAVMVTAKLFGNRAAWEALLHGEEHGISEYESALEDEALPEECRDLLETRLLPAQRRHVTMLQTIQQADSHG